MLTGKWRKSILSQFLLPACLRASVSLPEGDRLSPLTTLPRHSTHCAGDLREHFSIPPSVAGQRAGLTGQWPGELKLDRPVTGCSHVQN